MSIKQVRDIKKKAQNKKLNIINQQREYNWDDRFHLGNNKEIIKNNNNNINIPKQKKNAIEYIKAQIKGMRRNIPKNNSNYNYEDDLSSQPTQHDELSFIRNLNPEEIEITINGLWEDLGVLNEYKIIFKEMINSMGNNINAKNEFYCLEIENLKKFEESLIKFGKEIDNREKSLLLIEKLNKLMESQFIKLNIEIPDYVIKDFHKAIQSIRLFSINVVLAMNSIREICSYSTINGKFDLDKLHKYNFDRNYLIKMRFDLDFLGKSPINNYKGTNYNFSDQGDPFLISVNDIIPISFEQSKKIRQCQYIIMQDVIFFQINTMSFEKKINEENNNNKGNNIHINNNNKVFKKNTKIIIDDNVKDESKLDDSNLSHLKRKLEPIKKENKIDINVEKDNVECINKEENYEKLNRNNIKNNFDDFDEGFINTGNEDDEDIENEIEKQKKEIARIKKEDEERKKKKNNDLEKLKELRELQKEKKEEEKRNKEIEELRKKEKEALNKKNLKEEEEKKNNLKEEKEKIKNLKEKEEKIKNIKEEEKIKNLKDNLKPKKQETNIKIKEENEAINELKNSILNTSHLNKYSRPNSVYSRRSMTPEQYKKNSIENYNFTFFTGEIKNFITVYNNYYKSIPEIQKSVFNIKLNIIEDIYLYNTPKIIICSDKKNKLLIKGICIFGFEFDNNIIKVIISHISSYNDIERDNIISFLILFIKEHIECDEIIIDLYYQFNKENNKFTFDNDIRDLFKNNLMFKWVKLENLNNHTRFQKMCLKINKDEILETVGNNFITMQKLIPEKLFEIQDNCIFSFKEINNNDNNINNEDLIINKDKYINLFSVVSIFTQLKNSENYEILNINEKYKNIFENEINFEEMNICNSFKFKMNETEIDSSSTKNNLSSNYINHCLNMYISPIFNSSISINIEGYNYNRIENNEITILLDNKTGIKFYLIPTKDENSIIISEVTPDINENFISNNVNIYDIFRDFYQNLNLEENISNNSNQVIYIPCFNLENKISCNELNCFKDIIIKKDDKEFKLNYIEENIKINFKVDPNNDINFKIPNQESNDIIIKNNFLIGIVNIDVLSNLSIPSILLFYVTKDQWIEKTK